MDDFERLATTVSGRDGVVVGAGRGFGAGALQVDGHIFAMRHGADLALKLPAGRVAELVAAGDGLAFDGGKGRPMKEWVVIQADVAGEWPALTEEALAFVAGKR